MMTVQRVRATFLVVIFAGWLLGLSGIAGANEMAGYMSVLKQAEIDRLEARADVLQRTLRTGQKIGQLRRSKINDELAAIENRLTRLHAGDPQLLEQLVEPSQPSLAASDSTASAQARAASYRESIERQLRGGRKLGALKRDRLREELDAINGLIADLESGKSISLARIDTVIGRMLARGPLTKTDLRERWEIKRASLERSLVTGRKEGVLERQRIRDELERVDAIIAALEKSR